eukprot:14466339-Heterocapsa_arctica.AAC.1
MCRRPPSVGVNHRGVVTSHLAASKNSSRRRPCGPRRVRNLVLLEVAVRLLDQLLHVVLRVVHDDVVRRFCAKSMGSSIVR